MVLREVKLTLLLWTFTYPTAQALYVYSDVSFIYFNGIYS